MTPKTLYAKLLNKFQNPLGLFFLGLTNLLFGNAKVANKYIRPFIFSAAGAKIGGDCMIMKIEINGKFKNLTIGHNTWINRNTLIECHGIVEIGNYVGIGANLTLISSTHEIGTRRSRCGEEVVYQSVKIGDGVWIGSNCFISSNIVVEEGCVLSAGTVLQKSIPRNSLVAGNPGRFISRIEGDLLSGDAAEGAAAAQPDGTA